MNNTLQALLDSLTQSAPQSSAERDAHLRSTTALRSATDDDVNAMLAALAALDSAEQQRALPLITAIVEQLAQRARLLARERGPIALSTVDRQRIAKLYNDLQSTSRVAWALLGWLAALRSAPALTLFVELLVASPPADSPQLVAVLGPLFQRLDYDAGALFPALLDALAHKHLASAVLDLANYLTREKMLPQHPAQLRGKELQQLLGALVQRLGAVEEEPDAAGRSAAAVGAMIAESLPLAVSLCDALSLLGDREATGKLYQAMELKHRRLRTEAAAALARLGEKAGVDILIELASEPVARLRVLAYAQELNFLERIDEAYTSEAAQAEAQLALWLAQPAQFGIPPTQLELIDERELYWPGYDEPVDCFLFRFRYDLGQASYANIGIAGPLEHAFGADLADLPPDDIYAAFAGWHVEHEELREYDATHLNDAQQLEVTRLERRLHDFGLEEITPHTLALFFGERVLVAPARREGLSGIGIATSAGEAIWFPLGSVQRPIGPREAYCIFKGRRLLRTFNPESSAESEESSDDV
ncbi:MAG TPA: HEAT repeat domain-containing protein [Pirellulaceae bacterium]|nr:HEAT repeat domain-containing protein [Pirellulaceae bacterium]